MAKLLNCYIVGYLSDRSVLMLFETI